ncbi:MAG: DUF4386 domain-containing protein [Candidatus Eremiobacteraeota bacterium]|nr:DUF4386 domain-containing protein [Candidatus Eremiobacteraeota bacterium]
MPTSIKAYARTCGLLYLAVTILGVFSAMYVRGVVVIHGNPAATVASIAAHEPLWRAGILANVFAGAFYIAVTLMLYVLLKPVDERLSLLAAFFSLVGCATGAILPLEDYALVAAPGNVDLAKLLMALHGPSYDVCLTFFGCYCALLGYLMLRSTFFPKFVGALLLLGGVCYVLNTALDFLAPSFWLAFPFDITLISGIAELVLTLWLLVAGVNEQRWIEANSRA